jgi:peroxiredoxin
MVTPIAHPPETLEGWYALHQIYTCASSLSDRDDTLATVARGLAESSIAKGAGWSIVAQLIGSRADLMAVHFRPTLDEIGGAQDLVRQSVEEGNLHLDYSFLSVTEAGLYHLTAKLAQEAAARGGAVGDEVYRAALAERVAAERSSDHIDRRLHPPLPKDMPYVSFYPMTKLRDAGQNWYTLSLDERSRLMHSHGLTGRRYAGKVQQIITGAIGFDAWEWGVTLFAKDPLDFKKLVTDMRFDEVSAKYAAFGDFYVGKVVS